jgi:hypothetical protein
MGLYVILYHHGYGTDCTAQYFDHHPSQEEMEREMEIDLEDEEWLEAVPIDSKRLKFPRNHSNPCSPGCPGWVLNEEDYGIEKCDACKRFKSDDEAADYVRALETLDIQRHLEKKEEGNAEEIQAGSGCDL